MYHLPVVAELPTISINPLPDLTIISVQLQNNRQHSSPIIPNSTNSYTYQTHNTPTKTARHLSHWHLNPTATDSQPQPTLPLPADFSSKHHWQPSTSPIASHNCLSPNLFSTHRNYQLSATFPRCCRHLFATAEDNTSNLFLPSGDSESAKALGHISFESDLDTPLSPSPSRYTVTYSLLLW